MPSGLGAATTLVAADVEAIARDVPGVKHLTPTVKLRGWIAGGGQRFYGQILGTAATVPQIYAWPLSQGRFFDDRQVAARAAVAVLGGSIRDRLFGDVNPVGKSVTVRDRAFTVIGVSDTTDEDQLETLFVPYTVLQDALALEQAPGSPRRTAVA